MKPSLPSLLLRWITPWLACLTFATGTDAQEPASWTVGTLAGSAGHFDSADGTGTGARFNNPRGLAADASGTLYVADTYNHTVRMITSSGQVSTLAGSAGQVGSANGSGSSARFNSPAGVAVDSSGNVYVADTLNHVVRQISPDGTVSTFAGVAGSAGVDDGARLGARFREPVGVSVDAAGNVYVADTGNSTVRKIASTGSVTTLAGAAGQSGRVDGTGSEARFDSPYGVAVDSTGTVFVADTFNHAIRRISAGGVVTTIAGALGSSGESDGVGGEARFSGPTSIAVGSGGKLFVSEANHTIRMISPGNWVQRVAGTPGSDGISDGSGINARFNAPAGIALTAAGMIYVSDTLNSTLRSLVRSQPPTTPPPPANPATRIINISTRSYVSTEDNIMIAGFFITGSTPKQVLIRASGPALAGFGIPGALADPRLELHATTLIASNDNWDDDAARIEAAAARVSAFAWARGSKDAAMLITLPPGAYTAKVSGVRNGTGAALVEVYDADEVQTDSKLVNISTRSLVKTGGDVQIAGFVITGPTAKRVLIRANGPSLNAFGVAGALADPELTLHRGDALVAYCDDWGTDASTIEAAATAASAFAWTQGSKDAAMVVTLQPGAYTATVNGKNNGTGVALIEVYALD